MVHERSCVEDESVQRQHLRLVPFGRQMKPFGHLIERHRLVELHLELLAAAKRTPRKELWVTVVETHRLVAQALAQENGLESGAVRVVVGESTWSADVAVNPCGSNSGESVKERFVGVERRKAKHWERL